MAMQLRTSAGKANKKGYNFFRGNRFKVPYFTSKAIKFQLIPAIVIFITGLVIGSYLSQNANNANTVVSQKEPSVYWMKLHRKSAKEFLLYGVAGDESKSKVVKEFIVKTGMPGQRPTPLPELVGRKYWKIIKKYPSMDNPETAPYFLELDVPSGSDWPYGPVPYNECIDPTTGLMGQCDWGLPGYFGLHGVNGDNTRLTADNPGSSGCIRHTDEDITYLYNLLEVDEGVRYYIEDK